TSHPLPQPPVKLLIAGHHKDHGVVFQLFVPANEMIGDLSGPVVGSRHDAYVLRNSMLNPRLAALQEVMG
ncbi:unnamed protein product, partial [Hapterophycus canaliculatus]